MIVEVNDTEKVLKVGDGTNVEEFLNFVAKMGYIREWTLSIKKIRGSKKIEMVEPTPSIVEEPIAPQNEAITSDLSPLNIEEGNLLEEGINGKNGESTPQMEGVGVGVDLTQIINGFRRTKR